ncbi:protein kinase domain-containing protein [Pseudalkalibacillus berkeleyi]|uniref:Protein kinase family protein n=1 Tax=Pseudalkalibacillus berkeleyi TaxID=1069813 RepID=A0ABS9H472_9BACL|nr:protein kinase family protein [Pseudalkalibacillus berkeleyi]MCF6138637.1 protein kinase family protein [Pseudalkalibacillus berkeleyi]
MHPTTQQLTDQVSIQSNQLIQKPESYTLIGKGRSAFVFKDEQTGYAIKIFFTEFEHLAKQEADIYTKLEGSPYYPEVYEVGHNYIVMEYIEGHTFYDCLHKGIRITKEMIDEVDKALAYARSKGLNPSDIHLQNLILTHEGTIKVIDVVRFKQVKACTQWDDLKFAHERFYERKYFMKKVPRTIIELVKLYYKKIVLPFRTLRSNK